MITKNEAEKMIEEQQAEIARLEVELTEEITKSIVIFKENHILKSTLSEIKKHQTACNALKFAIARVKELEDGARECIKRFNLSIEDYVDPYQDAMENAQIIVEQIFNLGE